MAYKRTIWQSGAEGGTLVSKKRLDNIEDGIEQALAGIPPVALPDAVMAAVAGDPTTQFAIQQNATLGAQMDTEGTPLRDAADGLYRYGNLRVKTVSDLPATGLVWPHRLGGLAAPIAPEGTLEAAELAVAMGAPMLDLDMNLTKDNIQIAQHDTDLLRMTGVSGNLADYYYVVLPDVDDRPRLGNGWGTQKIPTFEQFVAKMGGRVIISIEPKDIASVPALVDFCVARGLERSVIVNSATSAVVKAATDAGITGYQWGISSNGHVDAAVAAGAMFLEIPVGSQASALVNYALSKVGTNNLKWVIAGGIQKRVEATAALALGVHGMVVDSPGYIGGTITNDTSIAPYIAAQKVPFGWWHSDVGRPTFPMLSTDGLLLSGAGTYGRRVLLGNLSGPKVGTYSILWRYRYTGATGDGGTRVALWSCVPTDASDGTDTAIPGGYEAHIRANGQFQANRWTSGVSTSLGSLNTAVPADAAELKMREFFTPTTVAFVREDTAAATTSAVLASGTPITSLPVAATALGFVSGQSLRLPTGQYATVSGTVSAGATSIPIASLTPSAAIPSGSPAYWTLGPYSDTTYRGDYLWAAGGTGGASNHLTALTGVDIT